MREVQEALSVTGIPTYALKWRVTAEHPEPPDPYLVYTTRMYESEHWDDTPIRYTVFVYLNMWTKQDPTDLAAEVRAAMRNGGFVMEAESTTYDDSTDQTLVAWTWQLQKRTELSPYPEAEPEEEEPEVIK